jgi:hypothetical protein
MPRWEAPKASSAVLRRRAHRTTSGPDKSDQLAVASLLTGLVQSLGTKWGLIRHYWVLAKLLITVVSTLVLLMYTQTLSSMADVAAATTLSADDLATLRTPSVVLHATAALLLLVGATALAVYKPPGLTRDGWRKQHEQERASPP